MKKNVIKLYEAICFDREKKCYVRTNVVAYTKKEAIKIIRKNNYRVKPDGVKLVMALETEEQERKYIN